MLLKPYERSYAVAPGSVYVPPTANAVLFTPFSTRVGDIVSIMIGVPVRCSFVIIAVYPLEFLA